MCTYFISALRCAKEEAGGMTRHTPCRFVELRDNLSRGSILQRNLSYLGGG